ncbi:MAG TPA: hypothetical protein VJX67_00390 [Blastocatellia bacterium]|nr:hypothetical protein [Blastocatellia bacterium]
MSAKLTVIFFIIICFEIGLLLVYLPWHRSWTENHLLILAADRMHWSGLVRFVTSGYTRGAITGLGVLNMMLGGWEIMHFKKTVRAFQVEWQGEESRPEPNPASVSDNGPAETGRDAQ